ncbi:Retrovirus-related Pol polyprotein from transposon TNT 1-94, partial [Anthophora quadrimaculata]
MATKNQLALIEKLSGRENYATWRFAMQTYLQHEELWDCIESGSGTDVKRDTKAKTKIILSVDPTNYVHIQEASTAKEVWDKLSSTFDDSGLTRRVGLLRDLCNTSLTGCQNVEEYVSKIISTAHKLRNIGFKVDDEWLGTLLLSGLPESYQPMIIAIESSDMKITSDSVKAKLLQDVRPSENDTKAFSVSKKFQQTIKKHSKGPRCYSCNKYGHKSPECKSKPKATSQKLNSSSYAAVFIATTAQYDAWYVDSGASSHMVKDRSLIQNEATSVVKSIKVADNKVLSVQCSGQVSLNTYNGKGQENKVLFTNVLCVPDLATNLLSVSQIIRSGGQVRFGKTGCVIMNNKEQIVATANIINNMYRLNMPEKGYACMSDVEERDIFLWHQRMGHLNFNSLKKMPENTNCVTFSRKLENVTCVTCKQGKQARLPFKSEGNKAKVTLQLVHSDICGPMETQTLGGAKYFITFLDDYSKKVYVYFLRNKSDALEKFKEFRHEVNR